MKATEEPVVTRCGALDMQVCVPEGYPDWRVLEFAEEQNPCGTTGGWQIRREGSKYLAGAPERNPCDEREGFVHITLDA
jgi:hypothetical protein